MALTKVGSHTRAMRLSSVHGRTYLKGRPPASLPDGPLVGLSHGGQGVSA